MPNKIDIKRSSKSTGSILQQNAPKTQFVAKTNRNWNFNMLKLSSGFPWPIKCSDQPLNNKMTNLTPILKFQYITGLA